MEAIFRQNTDIGEYIFYTKYRSDVLKYNEIKISKPLQRSKHHKY